MKRPDNIQELDLFASDREIGPEAAVRMLCDAHLETETHTVALLSLLHNLVDNERDREVLSAVAHQVIQLSTDKRRQFLTIYWTCGWQASGRGKGLLNLTQALNSHAPHFPEDVYETLSELAVTRPDDAALTSFLTDYQARFITAASQLDAD